MMTTLFLALAIPFEMPYDGKATVVIDDAAGQRVRNLVSGLPFARGRHTVEWDGRTEAGTGADPGPCTVRVFTHRGLSYAYRGSFGAGGEKGFAPFGPNHLPCSMAMARGDKVVLASLFTEGGNSTLVLNLDGSLHHGWGEGWNLGNAACVYLPGSDDAFYALREGKDHELQFLGYGWRDRTRPDVRLVGAERTALRGAAQIGGKVYVANGLTRTCDVYRLAETPDGGRLRAELGFTGERTPCPEPGPLAAAGGELVAAFRPDQLALAADTQFVYAVEKDVSVVRVYDRRTHALVRTLGEDGGGYAGAWRRNRLVRPTACALDAEGFLWVTENRFNPKRISRWDVRTGACVFEKFGSERYGAPGSGMDEEDPTRWMAHDTEWRYDPARGVDAPIAQSQDETCGGGIDRPPQHARTYRWVRRDGRTYVIGNDSTTVFYAYLEDARRLQPLALVGSPGFYAHSIDRRNTCTAMGEAYRRAFPETAGRPDAFKYDEETLMVWRDRNGDGRYQADEFAFAPRDSGAVGGWGIQVSDLDFTVCVTLDGGYSLLDFRFPDWSMADALARRRAAKGAVPPGVGPVRRTTQTCTRDGHSVLLEMSPYMLGFDRTGLLAWYMKNPWIGVHGSHNASLPVPGELQGVLFSIGSVPCGAKGEREAMAVKNNHGRVFFVTTDGIYLDELFTDCRVAAANNETYIGGESFGGSFQYDRRGHRAILTSGGGGYRWYEIAGLDTLEETSYARTFTARELVEAQERAPRVDPQTVRRPAVRVPRAAPKGGRTRIGHWGTGAQSASLEAAWTDAALQLRWDVRDPSPWVNNGTDPYEMFKTGDGVDFQFLNAAGDPERVMVSPKAGEPAANQVVWYRHRAKTGNPHDFASPWRTHHVGDVRFPTNFPVRVQRHDGRYTVDLALPRTLFGDGELVCDFGVIFGDRDGTINQSRVYWANPETGLVNDVPGEIIPAPGKWGRLLPADDGSAAAPPRAVVLRDLGTAADPHGVVATSGGSPLPGSDHGVGPVFDPARRILYHSAGTGRIVARTLEGPVQRVFTLPKARPFDRFDALVRADTGELYVLAGGVAASNPQRRHANAGLLFRIDPGRPDDRAVTCLASNVCAIAQHVRHGALACMLPDSTVALCDLATGALSPCGEAVRNGSSYPCMLDWTPQGELMAVVEHRNGYIYRGGRAEPGPSLFGSREISMQRGVILDDALWVLAGGTIKRYDARTMRPAPGVVYGGASGYFIGYTKMNTEMSASGICALGDGRFAVHTPDNASVYVMRYDAARQRLVEERRLGGFVAPTELLVDDEGTLLCDGLAWPFDELARRPDLPPRSTKTRMPRRAAAVLPDGTAVLVTETHGSKIEFRTGKLADERMQIDHRTDVKPYPEGSVPHHQAWGKAQPVSTLVFPGASGGNVLFAVLKDGVVKRFSLDAHGHPRGDAAWPDETALRRPAGVEGDFLSAAALPDGRILASVGGTLVTYAEAEGTWRPVAVDSARRADAVACTGARVALADARAGTLSVCAYADGALRELARAEGLAEPARVAFCGERLAVWERGAQRLHLFRAEKASGPVEAPAEK